MTATSYQIRRLEVAGRSSLMAPSLCQESLLGFGDPVWNSSVAITLFSIRVGDQLSLLLAAVTTRVCQPPGPSALQRLFKEDFQSLAGQREAEYAITYGRFRIERISEVVAEFVLCGDCSQGTTRIQCTHLDCRYEYFRPFSCRSFDFCPSCFQKRLAKLQSTSSTYLKEVLRRVVLCRIGNLSACRLWGVLCPPPCSLAPKEL